MYLIEVYISLIIKQMYYHRQVNRAVLNHKQLSKLSQTIICVIRVSVFSNHKF